jgi:hypothetical protein
VDSEDQKDLLIKDDTQGGPLKAGKSLRKQESKHFLKVHQAEGLKFAPFGCVFPI